MKTWQKFEIKQLNMAVRLAEGRISDRSLNFFGCGEFGKSFELGIQNIFVHSKWTKQHPKQKNNIKKNSMFFPPSDNGVI